MNYLHNVAGKVYLGGPVTGIQQPIHYDFRARRDTPNELQRLFPQAGLAQASWPSRPATRCTARIRN